MMTQQELTPFAKFFNLLRWFLFMGTPAGILTGTLLAAIVRLPFSITSIDFEILLGELIGMYAVVTIHGIERDIWNQPASAVVVGIALLVVVASCVYAAYIVIPIPLSTIVLAGFLYWQIRKRNHESA